MRDAAQERALRVEIGQQRVRGRERVDVARERPRGECVELLAAVEDEPPADLVERDRLDLAAEPVGAAPGQLARRAQVSRVVAQVVEVSVDAEGELKVDRVVCAVACGLAINPDVVKAQMEGGIGFALSTALHGAITLDKGAVVQSNFHDYPLLRINEMPRVEVHIVPSQDDPTGVGEPGVPPLAPALANAIFAATGERVRTLPIRTPLRKAV